MARYAIRRLLLLFPVLFIVSLIVFFSIRLVPGDTAMALVADVNLVDQRSLEVLRDELGLDEPAVKQYGLWLGRALKGDLGTAFHGRQPVISNIARAAPVTLELGLMALIISLLVAIPIGVFSAIRADTWTDYGGRLFAVFGIAVPDFILGVCMVILPAIWFNWTPAVVYIEFLDDPIGNFKQFILPALAIGFRLTSVLARMTRSSMLEVLRQDYIRTAWSKGLGERTVVLRHALKNAMVAPLTIIGTQMVFLLGGAVVVENIFGLPGMGRSILQSVDRRDYPQLMGSTLVLGSAVVVINLAVDLAYAWVDPRIRYQ